MSRLDVIVCGAGPAGHVGNLIDLAHLDGWDVRLIATNAALTMIDVAALEAQLGRPVRTGHRQGNEVGWPRTLDVDALVIAPATFNTINKLAFGISDTYPLTVAAEAIGRGIPVGILPFVNSALACRRPYVAAIEYLRDEGVTLLQGGPHPPGTGGVHSRTFPWHIALPHRSSHDGTVRWPT